LVRTKERYGSNIPEGRYMFSYATPNNIFAFGFNCLLYSQPITLDFISLLTGCLSLLVPDGT
jgi:hypothetical protein